MKLIRRRKDQLAQRPAEDSTGPPSEGGHKAAPRPTKSVATPVGIGIFVVGVFVLGASFGFGAAWTEVGVSVGTGLLLAGFVLWLEPRLVREFSETAGTVATTAADLKATEVAQRIVDESTAEIRERIEQLETLREVQQRIAAERQAAATQLMDKVREQPDFASTFKLLDEAHMKNLFARDLSLRCGSNQELLMGIHIDDMQLNFDATGEPVESDPYYLDIKVHSPTNTLPSAESYWSADESIKRAWNSFLDACEKESVPMDGIDLTDVFAALAASYEVMIEARRSPAGDPKRLQGQLKLLINDEWAITSTGLESRLSNHSFATIVYEEDCPNGHSKTLWIEAVFYAGLWLPPF